RRRPGASNLSVMGTDEPGDQIELLCAELGELFTQASFSRRQALRGSVVCLRRALHQRQELSVGPKQRFVHRVDAPQQLEERQHTGELVAKTRPLVAFPGTVRRLREVSPRGEPSSAFPRLPLDGVLKDLVDFADV